MTGAAHSSFDARQDDLTWVLSEVSQMTGAAQDRAAYFEGLRCLISTAAKAERAAEVDAGADRVQETIDAFGRATGRMLSSNQRRLLEQGVQALAQIIASQQNRNDLNLVRSNIGIFIENLAQVLGKVFSASENRLLVRALMRLVADGSQNSRPA